MADEGFLLALLNSTPVIEGVPTDDLADAARARRWLVSMGGLGTEAELREVRQVREALQAVVRGEQPPGVLAPFLEGVTSVAALAGGRVTWTVDVPSDRELAVRAVLAWDALAGTGRLRPCANDECQLFLIDRSKANAARWCSMAVCGNRMKARRHYQRGREHATTDRSASLPAQPAAAGQRERPPTNGGTLLVERTGRGVPPLNPEPRFWDGWGAGCGRGGLSRGGRVSSGRGRWRAGPGRRWRRLRCR